MPAGGGIKPALKVPRVNLRVHERHKLERPAAAKGPEEDRPPERPARAQDARRTRVIIIISAAGGARPSPHRGHIEDIMQARRTSRRTSKAKTSPASSSRAQTSSSARRTRASPPTSRDFSMSRWIGSQVPELENGWEQAYKPIHPSKGLLKAFRLVPGSTLSAFRF